MVHKLSFVVPVYHVPAQYLTECINSILNQSEKDIELVLVDDGSTKDNALMCDNTAVKDRRVKVIHKENGGLSAARNSGVRACTGDYISFVDADDVIYEDAAANLMKWVSSDAIGTPDFVISKLNKIANQRTIPYTYYYHDGQVFTELNREELQNMVLDFNANISTVCAKAINRHFLISKNLWHDEELAHGAEGIEFNFRMFSAASKVVFDDDYNYGYRYDEWSITSTPSKKNDLLSIRSFDLIRNQINSITNPAIKVKLKQALNVRVQYLIVSLAVSSVFVKVKGTKYRDQREFFLSEILTQNVISEALNAHFGDKIGMSRKVILSLLKNKLYFVMPFLSALHVWKKARVGK